MNIYLVNWTNFGHYGLSAVVVANTGEEALKMLALNDEYNTEIECRMLGVCSVGFSSPEVVCQESL